MKTILFCFGMGWKGRFLGGRNWDPSNPGGFCSTIFKAGWNNLQTKRIFQAFGHVNHGINGSTSTVEFINLNQKVLLPSMNQLESVQLWGSCANSSFLYREKVGKMAICLLICSSLSTSQINMNWGCLSLFLYLKPRCASACPHVGPHDWLKIRKSVLPSWKPFPYFSSLGDAGLHNASKQNLVQLHICIYLDSTSWGRNIELIWSLNVIHL